MPVPESIAVVATVIKEYSGPTVAATAIVLGVASWMGVGIEIALPFAAKAETAALRADIADEQKTIRGIQAQQDKQISRGDDLSCTIYQLLKDRYLKEQSDAEADLLKNPASGTLQRAREEAQGNVIKINAKLNQPPCA